MNRRLKDIGRMVGLPHPLTMHCARHSWASVAKHKRIPLSVISESMGHDSEGTTMIYLSSLDTAVIDEANKQVLKELCILKGYRIRYKKLQIRQLIRKSFAEPGYG